MIWCLCTVVARDGLRLMVLGEFNLGGCFWMKGGEKRKKKKPGDSCIGLVVS